MTSTDEQREIALAAEPLDRVDAAILNSLRAYYDETDPVPDALVERIQFELTLDALHAEVATLTELDLTTSGVRGGASTEAVRTVTFSAESLTTMVTITPQPDGSVRVDGWAAPGAGIRVEALLPDGPRETRTDEDGRFVFEALPHGMAKFVLHTTVDDEPTTVLTPTIEL